MAEKAERREERHTRTRVISRGKKKGKEDYSGASVNSHSGRETAFTG